METTTIKVTETKEREVELALPYYSKNGHHFYKVHENSDWGVLKVVTPHLDYVGDISATCLENGLRETNEPLTPEEFEEAFNKTLENILKYK